MKTTILFEGLLDLLDTLKRDFIKGMSYDINTMTMITYVMKVILLQLQTAH